jgi:hypothetical protein
MMEEWRQRSLLPFMVKVTFCSKVFNVKLQLTIDLVFVLRQFGGRSALDLLVRNAPHRTSLDFI